MYVLGLTGPIASGKSTVAQVFREVGAEVWDADVAVKRLYKPHSEVTKGLVAVLGEGILRDDGRIDTGVLVEKIREDASVLDQIEDVVFAVLPTAWFKWVKRRKSPLLVLEAPLLFEAGLAKYCNHIIVCEAPDAVRKERALARPQVDAVWFEIVNGRQMSTAEYVAKADVVLDGTDLEAAKTFVKEMWETYGADSRA